jgi:hypothetical protein
MNAEMSKHSVDPPPPVLFDRTETPTARTGPNLRDEGADLILSDFGLDSPDQEFAVIMGKAKVAFRRQLGPLDVADCR